MKWEWEKFIQRLSMCLCVFVFAEWTVRMCSCRNYLIWFHSQFTHAFVCIRSECILTSRSHKLAYFPTYSPNAFCYYFFFSTKEKFHLGVDYGYAKDFLFTCYAWVAEDPACGWRSYVSQCCFVECKITSNLERGSHLKLQYIITDIRFHINIGN